MKQQQNLLYTIPFSHYCEKAKWALDMVGIQYKEVPHLPVFHFMDTIFLSKSRSVPILKMNNELLTDSTDIVLYADKIRPKKLLPSDQKNRSEVLKLEEYFDEKLAGWVRTYCYFHMLKNENNLKPMSQNLTVPQWEKALCGIFPVQFSRFLKKTLRINPSSEQKARERIAQIFSEMDQLLEKQPFLSGNEFGLADLTFAALSAPLVLPKEFKALSIDMNMLTKEFADFREELLKKPAANHVMKLYKEYRF